MASMYLPTTTGLKGFVVQLLSSYNHVPQGLILGSKLFNMFIDDVDDRVEHTLSIFADNTKMLEGRVVFERDSGRLEKSS